MAQLSTKGTIHVKFEQNPFNSCQDIVVTNFNCQNPRWLPGGHLVFLSVSKIAWHNLEPRGPYMWSLKQNPFSSSQEIAITNCNCQNPRWLPGGHLNFSIRPKICMTQQGPRGTYMWSLNKIPSVFFLRNSDNKDCLRTDGTTDGRTTDHGRQAICIAHHLGNELL